MMSNWNIVTADDGKEYVEFSGIIMRPAAQVPEGVMVTLAPPRDGRPAKYSVVDGQLPPGMTLDPDTGTITGRPTEGPYQATVRVETAAGFEDRQVLLGAPPPAALPAADVDRVMNADGVVATFPRDDAPVDGIEAWRNANPSLGIAPGRGGLPEWLTGLIGMPGAIIGQAPLPPSVPASAYTMATLAAMRSSAPMSPLTDRSGFTLRGPGPTWQEAVGGTGLDMRVELWLPGDDEPAPPPPVRGRFQNLDFDEETP